MKGKKMKKYNIKFKNIRENELLIEAHNPKEALLIASDIYCNTNLFDYEISSITKYYNVIELDNTNIHKGRN